MNRVDADRPDTAELLDLARTIAFRCGRLICDERPDRVGVASTKSSPVDVVTVMDRRSEQLAAEILRAHRPHDGVLGEEGTFVPGSTGVSWLIDPIDGTVNYLYGVPEYCVSVAAVLGDPRGMFTPIAGAVYQPDHDEMYLATAEGPALAVVGDHERPLIAAPAQDLGHTLLATGFSYRAAERERQARLLTRVLPVVRDIRRHGAAALELCGAASGRHDAYVEAGLNAWDFAAGWLIAERAGLTVRGRHGGPPDSSLVMVGRAAILDALEPLIC